MQRTLYSSYKYYISMERWTLQDPAPFVYYLDHLCKDSHSTYKQLPFLLSKNIKTWWSTVGILTVCLTCTKCTELGNQALELTNCHTFCTIIFYITFKQIALLYSKIITIYRLYDSINIGFMNWNRFKLSEEHTHGRLTIHKIFFWHVQQQAWKQPF